MATLWQLDKTIQQIMETGFGFDEETGEVLFDSSQLDDLQMEMKDKLESCALFIKNQDALAKSIKDEEAALAARRKTVEREAEHMRQYVLNHLQGKVETPKVRISTRTSKYVDIVDEEQIRPEYVTTKTVKSIDKKAIRKALDDGLSVPGASLGTRVGLVLK